MEYIEGESLGDRLERDRASSVEEGATGNGPLAEGGVLVLRTLGRCLAL